ncbi:hypothetical protein SEA_NICEHOUSE_255 [Rhodococcus phage NiceHouse]|nr:hypothetical protein SEA_NICEHOUSE_255 [Rhodococcus phage NiceHouse]
MTTDAAEAKTSTKEPYRRDLNLNIVATFRPGSKVHGRRLEMLKEAVENALAVAMQEQLPSAKADVKSTMEWRYVFKEDESEYAMGVPVDADGNEIPEEEPETEDEGDG